ncbi:MAG TPA: cation transporter, partial [Mycobacterium sp.]|nr:cation transporter [Mycobacterium sp.]
MAEAASTNAAAATAVDFTVRGMTCGSCANRVQRTLGKQPGVAAAEVNFATATAHVVLAEQPADPDALTAAVAKAGYQLERLEPQVSSDDTHSEDEEAAQRSWAWRVIAAWPLGLATMAIAFTPAAMAHAWAPWVQLALATPVQFVVGWPFLREAVRRARRLSANMDTLVAIGTLTAYTFSVVELLLGRGEL